ncbi:hypothetical protein MKW98_016558 [Papaver atlanticum]|uniref:Uncharacterized protein n=1 Tax=Papaver atlanticum TaxID=357466 RepID=A0AAD4RYW1_9MAGN|nr:hypothetical protein MKW98_016558 [Papaver atlanticum]
MIKKKFAITGFGSVSPQGFGYVEDPNDAAEVDHQSRSAMFSSWDAIIGFKYTEPSHLHNTKIIVGVEANPVVQGFEAVGLDTKVGGIQVHHYEVWDKFFIIIGVYHLLFNQ